MNDRPYLGKLHFNNLVDWLEVNREKLITLGDDLGLGSFSAESDYPMRRVTRRIRLYLILMETGYDDLDLIQETLIPRLNANYLSLFNEYVMANGEQFYAVPEDMLAMACVLERKDIDWKTRIPNHLHWKDEVFRAISRYHLHAS